MQCRCQISLINRRIIFLVDVPAVVNPDFEQAVQEMTEADQVNSEEIIRAVHETQESITPPP